MLALADLPSAGTVIVNGLLRTAPVYLAPLTAPALTPAAEAAATHVSTTTATSSTTRRRLLVISISLLRHPPRRGRSDRRNLAERDSPPLGRRAGSTPAEALPKPLAEVVAACGGGVVVAIGVGAAQDRALAATRAQRVPEGRHDDQGDED